MAKRTDNTVVSQANTVKCVWCGQSVTLKLPLPLKVGADLLRSFSNLHRYCEKSQVFVVEVAYEPSTNS